MAQYKRNRVSYLLKVMEFSLHELELSVPGSNRLYRLVLARPRSRVRSRRAIASAMEQKEAAIAAAC